MKMKTLYLGVIGPALCFGAGRVDAADAAKLTFPLLGRTVCRPGAAPAFPRELAAMDGKAVTVTGCVCPYDQHVIRLRKFILTPEQNPGCYFCNPPEDNAVVFVRMPAAAAPMTWKSDTVTIRGTLHLKGSRKDDKEGDSFLATVDDASVVARH